MPTPEHALGLLLLDPAPRHAGRLLAPWNPRRRTFHFLSGHRAPGATFRDRVGREVSEELNRNEVPDFTIVARAREE
jgi:hypothetical protein